MSVNFDVDKINSALADFNNATDIRIDLLDATFSPLSHREHKSNDYCSLIQSTKQGKKACSYSDFCLLTKCKNSKNIERQLCHAGLIDIGVPIIYDGEILGYLVIGQMRESPDFSKVENYIAGLGLDAQATKRLYSSIPLIDSEKIKSLSNVATMLVKYILLENMLSPDLSENIQRAIKYINENLDKDLSIKNVSKNANISKSVLYKKFRAKFGCTVSEYINKQRINASLRLVTDTSLSIDDISQKVGFTSASYYSKLFKKQYGVSPLKYRRR